jgi:hypothetical protein
MHARVTRITTAPAELTDGMLGFRAAVIGQAQASPGYRGAIDLIDRGTGRAIAITLWETEVDLKASERARKGPPGGGPSSPSVETYEVVLRDWPA